jgi:hypothetical protein
VAVHGEVVEADLAAVEASEALAADHLAVAVPAAAGNRADR